VGQVAVQVKDIRRLAVQVTRLAHHQVKATTAVQAVRMVQVKAVVAAAVTVAQVGNQ
jgi:hypothetical protein